MDGWKKSESATRRKDDSPDSISRYHPNNEFLARARRILEGLHAELEQFRCCMVYGRRQRSISAGNAGGTATFMHLRCCKRQNCDVVDAMF